MSGFHDDDMGLELGQYAQSSWRLDGRKEGRTMMRASRKLAVRCVRKSDMTQELHEQLYKHRVCSIMAAVEARTAITRIPKGVGYTFATGAAWRNPFKQQALSISQMLRSPCLRARNAFEEVLVRD